MFSVEVEEKADRTRQQAERRCAREHRKHWEIVNPAPRARFRWHLGEVGASRDEHPSPKRSVGASLPLMDVATRLATVAILSASFVPCITGSASAAAAQPPAETPAAAPSKTTSATVPEPAAPAPAPESPAEAPAEATGPAEASGATDAPEGVAVPDAPPTAAAAEEEPASTESADSAREGSDVPAATEAESPAPGPEKSNAIDLDLLSGDASTSTTTPRPRTRTVVRDPGAQEASIAAAYDAEYRPAHNPALLHVAARGLFAYAGGDNDVGGRLGGVQVDVGQNWNRIGYAVTASAWGGRVLLSDRVAEMNALVGIGPSLTLGRTALQQRGMIDLRLGYDFMYGVVNQRTETGTVLAPQDGASIALEQTENLLPHGPRAMLQLGLLSQTRRRYHHGFGVVFGYQGLVGSMRGELPFTHMLVTGLQWWMG